MKKVLLFASFCLFTALTAHEDTVSQTLEIAETKFENNALVLDFSLTPQESNDTWKAIVEQAQNLITQIQQLENSETEEFDVVAEALKLSQTVYELGKESNGSCSYDMFTTNDIDAIHNPELSSNVCLRIRFSITQKNNTNPETWNQILAIAESFANQMNNATESQFDIIANYVTLLHQTAKAKELITENIQISFNKNFSVESALEQA